MIPVRILHVSDLHLAEQPNLRSIVDRSSAVQKAIKNALRADIKHSVLHGKPYQLGAAFKGLLEEENIKALRAALNVSREQINDAIDRALEKIVLGDGSFKKAVAYSLRDQTYASSFDSQLLDCLCNFIEEEEPNLDAILITGDLATTGFEKDLAKGLRFLEGPSQSISKVPFHKKLILPGNHDRFAYTDDGFLYAPGGALFDTAFSNYWSNPVMAYDPLRNGDLSVVIVAADFGLQSKKDCTFPLAKVSRLSQGKVYPEILAELVRQTEEKKAEEKDRGYIPVVLWAIHFPPFFVEDTGWIGHLMYKLTKNLLLEKSLAREARKQQVHAILAGHTHEAQQYLTKKYGVKVLCAGSATQDDPADKQCQVIEVSLDSGNQPAIKVIEYEPDTSALITSFKQKI